MRMLRWPAVLVSLVLAVACSSDSNDPNPPDPGAVATITVTPANPAVEVGSTLPLTAVARDANGTLVSVTVTWSSSSTATATVNDDGVVTGVAEGNTDVIAASGAVHSAATAVTVTAAAVWPSSGTSSANLIDAAVAAGTLTAEQGLVYKVFAAFSDRRLPVAYRGPVEATVDNAILGRVANLLPTLTPATQATLAPFMLTPGDPNGWYAARFPFPTATPGGVRQALTATEDCTFLDALFTRRQTTHFAVHYVNNDVYGAAVADIIMPELERVWTTEVEAFGREPISDANVVGKGNGCDGKLDIWLLPFAFQLAAGRRADPLYDAIGWTTTYEGGCAPRAAYIGMWATPFLEPKKLRGFLAHEFFHVLEFSYTHASSCADPDWTWLGEATANWAMDLVYPTDNYEHQFASGYLLEERQTSIDEPGNGVEPRMNGYDDYIFLLYLARTYGNAVIKDIWDATAGARSVEAVVAGVGARGGIDNVWPEFALSLWNNYPDHDEDFLHDNDDLVWGLREMFDRGEAGNGLAQKTDSAALNGGPRRNVRMLETTIPLPGLRRLSIHANRVKFTDPLVASVLYLNPLALAAIPHFKIQALVKIGGTWQAPEDWTHLGAKAFCRDLGAERIQELVLIYSNSSGVRSGQESEPIQFLARPTVGVSNVGCNKWVGTSSETLTSDFGGSTTSVSNLSFERERPSGAPLPDGSGQEAFTLVSGGPVIVNGNAVCITYSATGPAAADDGRLLLHLDNQFFDLAGVEPPDRLLTQGDGATTLSTTTFNSCNSTSTTGDNTWTWLSIPLDGASAVSANGRSISGDTTIVGPAGSQHTVWNLTAVREP